MAGYTAPRKTIRLVFEDRPGLEVRARSISMGKALELMGLAETARNGGTEGVDKLFRDFAAALIEWNLQEEDGAPIPPDYAGVMAQDTDFAMALVLAWMDGVTASSGPLGRRSGGGDSSPDGAVGELSIPMEPLPADLQDLLTPN
jgi:hypothetical protein